MLFELFRVSSRLINAVFFVLLVSMVFIRCGNQPEPPDLMDIHGRTMGTTYSVKVVIPPTLTLPVEKRKPTISKGIDELLKKVNLLMSTWIEESEISRFNRFRETGWFEVSPDTAKVVAEALRTSRLSGGAFDVTVGPLVNLWGFGPPPNRQIPTDEQIRVAMKDIGFQNLSVREDPPALKKEIPGIYCDLSAIAKGFGVDKVGEYLEAQGFSDYLVEIGGEVRGRGTRPDHDPWHVAIASPGPGGKSPYRKIILLKNMSMATSGDYFNYFEKDGVRFSHTIDPVTGKPITHKLASVSVLHRSCMTADALATAINVLGPDKGYELALKENLAVFLIIREKDGFIEKMTPAFREIPTR